MNIARMAVLSIAVLAAGGAALLVRGGLSGANQAGTKPLAETTAAEDVLVAASDIAPGHVLDSSEVRWQAWPKAAISPLFITKARQADSAKAIAGLVSRAPLVSGEPVTGSNTVNAKTTGFMAATITPGMRGIGVPLTPETSAGGFILPNDRVDLVLTRDVSGGTGAKSFQSQTLLRDVRVLAVDQTVQQEKDKQTVVGKTATIELTPEQTELVAQAEQTGVLSLTLRSLGDSSGVPLTAESRIKPPVPRVAAAPANANAVRVFRYGVLQGSGGGGAAGGGGGPGSGLTAATGALQNPLGVP